MQKKSFETILFSGLGIMLMLGLLVALNVITGAVPARIDLTQEKAYTLSAGTKAILKKLDTPVKIRFYCTQSETATPETVFLKNYARKVEDLLAEYEQVAGKNLITEKYDPQPDSDAEDSARLDGLEPETVPGADRFYLGLSVNLADARETIPFLQPTRERLLEYDLTRAVSRVVTPEKPTLGVMSGLPVFGMPANPMMQMRQQGMEQWTIITELRGDYNVKRVDLTTDKIDDDIKVLLVIHPKDISDKAQYAIDQFVLRGGKLIAFLDPFSVLDSRAGQSGMLANMGGSSSNLEKLLKAWGYTFEPKVVADLNFMMKLRGPNGAPQDAPAWLGVMADGINKDDVASSQIDNIWMPLAGAFTGVPVAGLKETVLLHSTKESQLVDGFLANLSGESIIKEFKPSGVNYKLAIRLTGKFKTAFTNGKPEDKKDEKPDAEKKDAEKQPEEKKADDSLKECQAANTVVLFGDADMLYDNFALRKFDSPFGQLVSVLNGNLSLAQNLVEQMTGDSNLIAVRSRAETGRPFTRVRAMQAEAEQKFQAEIKRLEDSLADTQRKLNELQQQKTDKDQRFILSPEQRAALEKFRKDERDTKLRLKQVQKDLRKEVVSLETRLKWINILAMPLAVTVTGIVIAIVKRKKTSAK